MEFSELERLVESGESETMEFKRSTSNLRRGMESLCGMLNGSGGTVLFGVAESGAIKGQDVSDKTLREIAGEITKLEPPVSVPHERVRLDNGKEVLILTVPSSPHAPHTYDGRPYRKITSTTSTMPQTEYQRRLAERGYQQSRWETELAQGYSIKSLDQREIRRTVREAIEAGRLESAVSAPGEVLRRLHLTRDGRVLRAAVVAFAREVQPSFPQCSLRMARFRGTTKTDFLDQRQISGHAFQILDEATLFLRRHLPVSGRFEPGILERQDEPLFPLLALREALVNAICHRDYSVVGGAISIGVYDDRLEITSTGSLPFGLTVADLKQEHSSKPRNPTLAQVFYLRGLIERWGRGTQKIIELCTEAGHPEPEFEERAGELIVRFIPSAYIPSHRINHDLTDRQRRILHVLRDGAKHRRAEIKLAINPRLPDSTLRDDLSLLKSLGLIASGGHGRGSGWWRIPKVDLPTGGS